MRATGKERQQLLLEQAQDDATMMTPLDAYHESKGMQAKPHERVPTGAGTGCKSCVFSERHPVHNHRAEVINIFSRRDR